MDQYILRAEEFLLSLRRRPGMYASNKENFLSMVITTLAILGIEIDWTDFWRRYLKTRGNIYRDAQELVNDIWAMILIDEALALIVDLKSKE